MNPGRLRIPREQLYQGGVSDPRNPKLQKMFQFLGLGEKAGSGFQKILRAWREQHWLIPVVAEHPVMEMTRVWLTVSSMIPESVESELRAVVGDAYVSLDELDRVILMLAHRFGDICNADVQPYRREHPRDIGVRLKRFVELGWLEKAGGHGRGTRYRWPTGGGASVGRDQEAQGFEHLPASSEHSRVDSEHLGGEAFEALRARAAPVRERGKLSRELVEETLLAICSESWLSLRTLAELLGRSPDSLRNHYINPMLRDGRLVARVPGKPNHPNQAYRTAQE